MGGASNPQSLDASVEPQLRDGEDAERIIVVVLDAMAAHRRFEPRIPGQREYAREADLAVVADVAIGTAVEAARLIIAVAFGGNEIVAAEHNRVRAPVVFFRRGAQERGQARACV